MRTVYLVPDHVEDHPLDLKACRTAPAGMDLAVLPAEAVEDFLIAEEGLAPSARHLRTTGGSSILSGILRDGDGTVPAKLTTGTVRSILRHAERVVVCDTSFPPKQMLRFLGTLSKVAPSADCCLHPFVRRDRLWNLNGVCITPHHAATLERFGEARPGDDGIGFYAPSVGDAVSGLAAVERVDAACSSQTRAHSRTGQTKFLIVPLIQALFWARRHGGWPSPHAGGYPFGLQTGALYWNRCLVQLTDARILYPRRDRAGFQFTEGDGGAFAGIAPAVEDAGFGDRLAAWWAMPPEEAEAEIGLYTADIVAKQAAWAASRP